MDFQTAIKRILKNEGGYTAGIGDPGGETNFGISKRSYPKLDIKNLTRQQAVEIYHQDFWVRVHADTMHEDLSYQALDFAVNSGIETAVRKLQSAANVADDGYWGPVTQKAIYAMPVAPLLFRFLAKRLDYNTRLSNWPQAGRGWARRAAQNMMYAADDLLNPDGLPIED